MCIKNSEAEFCDGRKPAYSSGGAENGPSTRRRRSRDNWRDGHMPEASAISRIMVGLMSASFLAAGVTSASAQQATLDRGDSVVTGFSGIRPSDKPLPPGANPLDHFFIDLDGASAQILSMIFLATGCFLYISSIEVPVFGLRLPLALRDLKVSSKPLTFSFFSRALISVSKCS